MKRQTRSAKVKSILGRVQAFIDEHRMIGKGEKLLAAVSGGPDSMVLLRLLQEMAARTGVKLRVAHLHHGLRGREADRDEDFVRSYCRRHKLPFSCARKNVRAIAEKSRLSLETAARMARYDFLLRCASETGAGTVAVGHTADDQAETFLMRLIRGAGARGLRGMLPAVETRGVRVVRPLLCLWRSDVLFLAKALGVGYRLDRSNASLLHFRNRVRRRLIPYIEREYNPNVKETIRRSAEILAGMYAYARAEAMKIFRSPEIVRSGGRIEIPVKLFLSSPAVIRRELLCAAMGELGAAGSPGYDDMRGVSFICAGEGESRIRLLPGGIVARREYGKLALSRAEDRASAGYEFDIVNGLELRFPGFLLRFGVEAIPRKKAGRLKNPRAGYSEIWGKSGGCFWPLAECVSGDNVKGKAIRVRNRGRGDRYRPLGLSGEKKLMRIMMDEKLPRRLRDAVPVVTCGDEIVWPVGYRIADAYRVTPRTKRVIRLKVEKIAEL